MAITVCVPTLKRYDLLAKLMTSLNASTIRPLVYVIDNGHRPKDVSAAVAQFRGKTIVARPLPPLGVAASWNKFLRDTVDERIIANDDVTFAPESIAAMVSQSAGFVSCGFGFSCFLIRQSCIEQVGTFDETLSPGYAFFEDVDYYHRMQLAGIKDAVVQCGVTHAQSQTVAAYSEFELAQHHQKWLLAKSNYVKKWGAFARDHWQDGWGPIPND